jgi:hypothetical protein
LAVEFSPPGGEPSQGDLFNAVPSMYAEDLRFMVKTADNAYSLHPEDPQRRNDRTYPANATEARSFGVLLTHDCEIDKQTRKALVHVALVRSLNAPAVPEEHIDGFRTNRRHRAFYLPPNPYLNGENYVDLRRISTLRADVLLTLPKLASMNEDGRRMLREHLFRFFTRRYLPNEWVDWPEDEA